MNMSLVSPVVKEMKAAPNEGKRVVVGILLGAFVILVLFVVGVPFLQQSESVTPLSPINQSQTQVDSINAVVHEQ